MPLCKVDKCIEERDYIKAIELGKKVNENFYQKLYMDYEQGNQVPEYSFEKLEIFIKFITQNRDLPFSGQKILEFEKKLTKIASGDQDNKAKAVKLYNLNMGFYRELRNSKIKVKKNV